jgi:hypothetical protein
MVLATARGEPVRRDPPGLWPAHRSEGAADYEDAFTARAPVSSKDSPEDWARRVLEGASLPMRLFLRMGWRVLGFRLHRVDAVLGWPVVSKSADWVVLQQTSWLFGVALLMRAADGELTWATRVSFRSPLARPVWWIVGAIHRRYAPRALQRAVDL